MQEITNLTDMIKLLNQIGEAQFGWKFTKDI